MDIDIKYIIIINELVRDTGRICQFFGGGVHKLIIQLYINNIL